ncbi:MAG TPA: DUF222 domain-containing protein, partial [Pseudonocardiaceae bacterium]|nr:DUF222 domain-containing protein [Pseudonocardiaceae bacterium]
MVSWPRWRRIARRPVSTGYWRCFVMPRPSTGGPIPESLTWSRVGHRKGGGGRRIRYHSPTVSRCAQPLQGRGHGSCGAGGIAGATSVAHWRDAAAGVADHGCGTRRWCDRPGARQGDRRDGAPHPCGDAPGGTAQAEQTLAHTARRFGPTALSRIGERLLAHLDPDGTAPAEEPETMRELRVRTGPDGTVSLNGKLDPEGGARVLEVLGSLNGRRPLTDGVPDQRSRARRDADALVEAMSSLLDEGELPTRSGQRRPLVLTMGLNELIESIG